MIRLRTLYIGCITHYRERRHQPCNLFLSFFSIYHNEDNCKHKSDQNHVAVRWYDDDTRDSFKIFYIGGGYPAVEGWRRCSRTVWDNSIHVGPQSMQIRIKNPHQKQNACEAFSLCDHATAIQPTLASVCLCPMPSPLPDAHSRSQSAHSSLCLCKPLPWTNQLYLMATSWKYLERKCWRLLDLSPLLWSQFVYYIYILHILYI